MSWFPHNPMIKNIYFACCLILILVSTVTAQLSYTELQSKQQLEERINSEWARQQPYVVLISIDGFRYDYASKYGANHIAQLGQEGARAKSMIPAFPSKTFPNHYTLVTGLLPGNHGLVSNTFYSREKKEWYSIGKKAAVTDGSWYGGVPLWVLAEQNDMLSASFFWVGSEATIRGYKPTYCYAYDGRVPNEYRLRQVVDWLKLPEEKRPHMITAYFSLVDDAGHRYGPDHDQTRDAVLEIDRMVGEFMAALDQLDLPVHVVLVSDHGMSAISRGIVLADWVDLEDSEVSYSFPPMIYQQDQQKVEALYRSLLEVDNLDVYKKENIPEYLSFQNTDRIGDLILLSQPPTVILEKPKRVSGGTHGFDPYRNDEMGAIFYASGPQIEPGMVLSPFENIHIYPFIAELLNLPVVESIDGSSDVLRVILKP